ncbi:MAG TPA: hypothetical protein PLU67_10525 [Candidatus Kapabacteria bacterium]|nr:hypothetical protein [Candidatus Kapabacteria bacterium]
MRTKKYRTKTVINAIIKNNGLLTYAAEDLRCHWRTVKNYINTEPEIRDAYEDVMEKMCDIAENVVRADIVAGNVETAKWYLRYKGKHRGYVDNNSAFVENTMVFEIPKDVLDKLAYVEKTSKHTE